MKYTVAASSLQVRGRLGPTCIACGNQRSFFVHTLTGDQLFEVSQLPPGEVLITSCGRCRSRNSILIGHLD